VADPETDGAALLLIEAFGITGLGDMGHRRAAWLCVLAVRKVLYGWAELGCEGDAPAQAVEAVADWVQTGEVPPDLEPLCVPAPAIRNGQVIDDCDACRARPIAAAAARLASFARSGDPADAVDVLFLVWCTIDEGIHRPNDMPFGEWIATVALPAAYDLRALSGRDFHS
jgi:hypothetical protein